MKLNFIDLFSGSGGMSEGFMKAGLNCLAGIDFSKDAIETFAFNHKKSIAICDDIRKIKIKDFLEKINNKKIHIICGGPPCQGFSTIGAGDAEDSRNHLFLEFVRFVKSIKPKIIVIENVTGILAKKNINTLKSIFKCFEKLGYQLDIKVLSSHHYGVPQKRRRVIIIGNIINVENLYPKKRYDELSKKGFLPPKTVGDVFSKIRLDDYNHEIDKAEIKKNIEKDRIKLIPEGKSVRYQKDERQYLPKKLWFDVNWDEIGENRFREARLLRLDRKKPSPTIVTSSRMYYHPTQNRYLTSREAASLQSFSNKFKFFGSHTSQWTQIGNAVPPIMAKEIGRCLIKMYFSKIKVKNKKNNKNIEHVRSTAFNYGKDVYETENKQTEMSFTF
jgi:DNA (cytosine-5)-methyltransferase 1